jgi:anti-sigma factor RsiW
MTTDPHLTEAELAGFLANELDGEERRRVEAHLDACDPCREEAIAVARLVDSAPVETGGTAAVALAPRGQRRRRWALPAGLGGLAAAGLAGILVWSGQGMNGDPMEERLGDEGAPRIEVHSPPPGAVIARDSLRFSWTDQGTVAYRVTLSAEDGALLWSASIADTLVVPPGTIDLPSGETLYWYVDAIGAGVVARSRAQPFRIVP